MIVSQLLEEALTNAGGRNMAKAVLDDAACGPGNFEPEAGSVDALLSTRERQIAQLVGTGNQNKQVAFITGISEFTVENHLRRIYRKLNVHNRAGMTAKLFGGQTYS
jgi:DNA-binding NarL/FixJ family response regulator